MFEKFKNKSFNSVTINGETITCSGSNIVIRNGKVIVDGNDVKSNIGTNVTVIINGDVNKIDCSGSVEVHGNSGSIDCGGSCTVDGNVNGHIDAGGSIMCCDVYGNIDAGGSVQCRR